MKTSSHFVTIPFPEYVAKGLVGTRPGTPPITPPLTPSLSPNYRKTCTSAMNPNLYRGRLIAAPYADPCDSCGGSLAGGFLARITGYETPHSPNGSWYR